MSFWLGKVFTGTLYFWIANSLYIVGTILDIFSNAILLAHFAQENLYLASAAYFWNLVKLLKKELICLLLSLEVIKRPSDLMVYSYCSYTRNGSSGTIIALISIDMHHQKE